MTLASSAMNHSPVPAFVDAALARLRHLDLKRSPGKIPEAMRDFDVASQDDWVAWKEIPSTVSNADLDALEGETGTAFPPLYREFLQYKHFVHLDVPGLRFTDHCCNRWKEYLQTTCFRGWPRDRILDIGLLPFGDEAFMDAGPVCFDTRKREADGDCPVVFWDHEWVNTDREICPMFSSSRKMFECLRFASANDLNLFYHHADDDASLLPMKKELMQGFLSIDPLCAGTIAREYWTSWGVSPDTP